MDNLILINKNKLLKNSEYIWKYLDIHKLISLLSSKTIRFTRMDKFEDVLEGIPFETLNRFLSLECNESIKLAKIILNPDEYFIDIDNNKIVNRISEINSNQYTHFVTCWFKEQRESMAMWDLYSNKDGVAIKIPFQNLVNILKVDIDNKHIKEYYCGNVVYQNLISKEIGGISKIKRLGLRKDLGFSHEKEVRFVLKTKEPLSDVKTGLNSKPLNFKTLGMQVICHPRMESWKKENIKSILRSNKLDSAFRNSEIVLRT